MLPRTSCSVAAAPIICTPYVCWVQPTAAGWRRSCRDRSCSTASPPPRRSAPAGSRHLGDHLRRVAGEVLLHELEDTRADLPGWCPARPVKVSSAPGRGVAVGNRTRRLAHSTPARPTGRWRRSGPGHRPSLGVLPGLRVVLTDEAVEAPLPFLIRTESGEDAERLALGLVLVSRNPSLMMVAALV